MTVPPRDSITISDIRNALGTVDDPVLPDGVLSFQLDAAYATIRRKVPSHAPADDVKLAILAEAAFNALTEHDDMWDQRIEEMDVVSVQDTQRKAELLETRRDRLVEAVTESGRPRIDSLGGSGTDRLTGRGIRRGRYRR